MMRKLVLCLSVVCLTKAASLDTRIGNGGPHGGGREPFTPADLADGVMKATDGIRKLQESTSDLIAKIVKGDKQDQEWFGIMTHMADLMKGSIGWFMDSIQGIEHLTRRMFEGDHGFERVTRCSSLADSIDSPDFGTDEFVPKMEVAIAKDLMCFSNMLKDVSVMKFETEGGCPPTEDQVIDFVAASFKDLFELRNDGERFFHAVSETTEKYSDKVPNLHGHFMNEMGMKRALRELIRALGKN